ncbi:MAG: NAD-dependent epimerase/dehydratase family protein [Patescibacteria group bacterium]
MKALLLGGTGFIGTSLARELIGAGAEVILVGLNSLPDSGSYGKLLSHQIDLTRPSEDLKKLADDSDIIVILTQPDKKIIDNLIEIFQELKERKKIIYLSSMLIYRDELKLADEKSPIQPVSEYEKGKIWEEERLGGISQTHSIIIARLANVYGNNLNRGIIKKIFSSCLEGKELTINGGGNSVRDYIYISDLTAFLKLLIFSDAGKGKEIYNICTGEGTSVNQLVKMIGGICNKEIKVRHAPKIIEKERIVGANGKITDKAGYRAEYDIKKGLVATYKNFLGRK